MVDLLKHLQTSVDSLNKNTSLCGKTFGEKYNLKIPVKELQDFQNFDELLKSSEMKNELVIKEIFDCYIQGSGL